VVVQTTGW
jgi:tetratricopeptide (TPR) repeat protein